MRTALITGNAGFVGGHLTDHLLEQGIAIADFDLMAGDDIRNYEKIRTAIDDIQPDLIFHLAGQAFVPEATTDPRRGLDINLFGTLNLLEAVRHTGSRARILLAGSSAEYGSNIYDTIDTTITGRSISTITEKTLPRPDTAYGVGKLAAGQLGLVYAQHYHMPIVVTRAFNHTGPGHSPAYAVPHFAKQIAEIENGDRDWLGHGNLDAVRNYTDVRDIVRGYAAVIDAEPGIYQLGAEQSVSLGWVLHQLCGLSEKQIELRPDPGLYRPGMQTTAPALAHGVVSIDKIHAATGWKPQIPLEQTLADTLDHWRTQVTE